MQSILLVLLFAIVGANAAQSDQRNLNGFVLANNHFGWKLLSQLSTENGDKTSPDNVFFSPYSISVALAMLHQGSGGETQKQIESVLGLQLANLTGKSEVSDQIRQDLTLLASDSGENKSPNIVKSGNALIVDKNFPLIDTYKENLQNNFRAEAFSFDFQNDGEKAKELINQWCANKTNGKIAELLERPPPGETKLKLINAVYFKAEWLRPFEPYENSQDKFYGLKDVKYENITFMGYTKSFKVAELGDLKSTLLELPYKGNDVSFYGILPNERNGQLGPVRKALENTSFIEEAIGRTEGIHVKLRLPKLNLKTEYDLVESLKKLGLVDPFEAGKADLSALSPNSQQLKVDTVKHVATVDVNEEGTEAAAVTSIGIIESSLVIPTKVKELTFDHPFLFFIRHNQNGQILFIGEVNKF